MDIEVSPSLGSRLIPYLFVIPVPLLSWRCLCIIRDLVYTGLWISYLIIIYFM